ncbi:MAG: hypothetical protein PHX74_09420 [Candidatus Sumerlaeales bacterium]|nr:hypothetical protein [Candidatus Sumerlaeales bacterium]
MPFLPTKTILIFAALFITTASTEAQVKGLLVGKENLCEEFSTNLNLMGVETLHLDTPQEFSQQPLDNMSFVVFCNPMTTQPLKLDAAQSQKLASFLQAGGHGYMEYTVPDSAAFPLWKFDEQTTTGRFETLAVMEDNLLSTTLMKDDLLEEHNSRVLEKVVPPTDARNLIQYGLNVGTYRIDHEIKERPTFVTVTVDLTKEYPLRSVEQTFGSGERNYTADLAKVSIAGNDKDFKSFAEVQKKDFADGIRAEFDMKGTTARYIRIYSEKTKMEPSQDFFGVNGIRVFDTNGNEVSRGQTYDIQQLDYMPQTIGNGILTNGTPNWSWKENKAHLYTTNPVRVFNQKIWDGLLEWQCGKGKLYYATTPFSVFRKQNYRLTSRWEALLRGLSLAMLPDAEKPAAAEKLIDCQVYTEPRRWNLPDTPVKLHIVTSKDAIVTPTGEGLAFSAPEQIEPGHFVCEFTPTNGEYNIGAKATVRSNSITKETSLTICSRNDFYRRALDRNMQWFLKSGIMPKADASQGVFSTIEVGALYAGKAEDLMNPFRADCQAMTGKAFWIYGDLTQNKEWYERAERLAKFVQKFQYTDPEKASFGGYKWLLESSPAIYPQDDNNRNSEFLAWLYDRTGNTDYLRTALRCVEFGRDISREDWSLGMWVIGDITHLNKVGRTAMRADRSFTNVTLWSMYRHHYGYRSTGNPQYLDAIRTLARVYAPVSMHPDKDNIINPEMHWGLMSERANALALAYLDKDDPLREKIKTYHEKKELNVLNRPDVKKYGSIPAKGDIDPNTYKWLFVNDSTIHTRAGEPLTDQLYTTSLEGLARWEAYKACPTTVTQAAMEFNLDYLVRIQMENTDERLDGCWLRSFDAQNWEYYGTRYDPNYGAYHAYSGWMNSIISQTLGMYLLDENPFTQYHKGTHEQGMKMLDKVRHERMPDYMKQTNLLNGVELTANIAPDLGSKNTNTITDGFIEGLFDDDKSAGWSISPTTTMTIITLTGKLNAPIQNCIAASIRSGGLHRDCTLNSAELWTGKSLDSMKLVKSFACDEIAGIDNYSFDPIKLQPYIQLRLVKYTPDEKPARLYIGEIRLTAWKGENQ